MNISFATLDFSLDCGYGVAGFNIVRSLQELGHKVPFRNKDSEVELWFSHPNHWKWSNEDQYRVGYVAWESTDLKPGWLDKMNDCNEIWTPNYLLKEWFVQAGVEVPIFVYEHGVADNYNIATAKHNKFTFLHLGSESKRKGGLLTESAFRKAFSNQSDVQLVTKSNVTNPFTSNYNNVHHFTGPLTTNQMKSFIGKCDVFVYPSYGEGFGLYPLEAMALGLPSIVTKYWPSYSRYLSLEIDAELLDSPWPQYHPGKMLHPNEDHLVEQFRYAYDHADDLKHKATDQHDQLKQDYNWVSLTKKAFDDLEVRMQSR